MMIQSRSSKQLLKHYKLGRNGDVLPLLLMEAVIRDRLLGGRILLIYGRGSRGP